MMTECSTDQQTPVPADSCDLAALHTRLTTLTDRGAQHVDPVRWHFINALLHRAATQPATSAAHIASKIAAALEAYEAAFTLAHQTATAQVTQISRRFPAHSARAQQLCNSGQFSALERLNHRLARCSPQQLLASLNEQLEQQLSGADHHAANTSFSASLSQQDRDIAARSGTPSSSQAYELKSVRRFRATRAKHHVNRLLNQTIAQCPVQSGPLNTHLLIVRSLSAMRDLSPHYVNRLISHCTTLSWLEHVGAHATARKPHNKTPQKRRP